MEKPKQGPVTPEERREYRVRMGSDLKWGRPTGPTAEFVWTLLKDVLLVQLDALMPKRGRRKPTSGEEYEQDARIAKQSLVVGLDCAITAGERGAMLTKNLLFDALARRWSRSYRRARRKGAHVSYDMRPETVQRALRELVVAGVRFDTLWTIIAGTNSLYSLSRAGGKAHPLGWTVDVIHDSLDLRAFEGAVKNDGQYRRRYKWRLLLAEDWRPRRRPVRQKVCDERPYNVVNLGEESERVLSILEQAQVRFNIEVFRKDYETHAQYLKDGHRPSGWSYRKLKGFVDGFRRVYEDTTDLQSGTVEVRSRFFRAPNRRYHASNFWPEHVLKEFRERWFSTEIKVVHGLDKVPSEKWPEFVDDPPAVFGRYIERDITVSQIQTLAVFLGLDELERLATAKKPTLKEWLAKRLWTLHKKTKGGLLAKGYTKGAKDPRLIVFAKKHLMYFYGADLSKIIRECGAESVKYGPGWRTTRGLWAKPTIKPGTKTVVLTKSGVTEAVAQAEKFIVTLPPWINGLETFLAICRTLASADKDPLRGVVFPDPLDKAEIRWHHAQRGTVSVGHDEIEVHPFGQDTAKGFAPSPPGTIDRTALARFIAPCLTHTLDAYFSSLVIDGLHAAGVTNVIALHDAWRIPETVLSGDDDYAMPTAGELILERVIENAGRKWLLGLDTVYDRLISYLGNDPTFGPFVHDIKARWEARVKAEKWPRFLAA